MDGLQLVAVTKPAGVATARVHVFDFDTGIWTHGDIAMPAAAIGAPYWGFNRALTDSELDAFADGLPGDPRLSDGD